MIVGILSSEQSIRKVKIMAYTINPAVFGSMFAVPSQVVDNNIKLASASQLKTLLWVFRHASDPIGPAVISKDLQFSKLDCVHFFILLCVSDLKYSDGFF